MTGPNAAGARLVERRPIDWRRAAELLAHGTPLAVAAEMVGCSRSHLSRKRNRDPEFRGWLQEAGVPGVEEAPNARLMRLRAVVHEAIEKAVKDGNVRVILWLADRLKLVSPPDERTPEDELRTLVGSLSPEELTEFQALGQD